jgi:ligand-binding SRPBCC domain-containing protein
MFGVSRGPAMISRPAAIRPYPGFVVVNVCPAAVTRAPAEHVWRVLTTPERFGEWLDARFVSVEPPGSLQAGQRVRLSAPSLGRTWPVSIEVVGVDPQSRWVDLIVSLPFGIVNHERVTLAPTEDGGTLVRFN